MATALQTTATDRTGAARAVVTRIVSKFQVTVPQEVRDVYDLREGDLFEWHFDAEHGHLIVIPKRAQLLTPRMKDNAADERRRSASEAAML